MGTGACGTYHPVKFKLPREIRMKKGRRGLNTFDIQQIHSWDVSMNTLVSFNKINTLHSWSQAEQDCFLTFPSIELFFRPNFSMLFRATTDNAFNDPS